MNQSWRTLITVEPGKRGGRPCIRGMRITVYDVLSYLAAGMTTQEVLDDFPYLTVEDIRVAGRSTQGVIVFDTAADEHVVSVEHITDEADHGNGNGG